MSSILYRYFGAYVTVPVRHEPYESKTHACTDKGCTAYGQPAAGAYCAKCGCKNGDVVTKKTKQVNPTYGVMLETDAMFEAMTSKGVHVILPNRKGLEGNLSPDMEYERFTEIGHIDPAYHTEALRQQYAVPLEPLFAYYGDELQVRFGFVDYWG